MTQKQYETVKLRLPKSVVEWYRRLNGNMEDNIVTDLIALTNALIDAEASCC